MPKITLLHMPLAEQAQIRAALRRALWLPPGGHGHLSARTSSPGWPKPADQRTTVLRQGRMGPRPRERRPHRTGCSAVGKGPAHLRPPLIMKRRLLAFLR